MIVWHILLTLFGGSRIVSSVLVAIVLTTVGAVRALVRHHDRVFGMGFDMLLQVLRPLEGLATEVASMRLQRDMDSDMRGDVVAFHNGDATVAPRTLKVEIVSTFATNVLFADMVLQTVVSSCHVMMVGWVYSRKAAQRWALAHRNSPTHT